MRILLVRHTRPLIASGICYGRLNLAEDPATHSQIEKLAGAGTLASSKRVWTSPARRCDILADAIARNLSIPKSIDPRLQELDFGEWEGKGWDDLPRSDLDDWARNPETFRPPAGEAGTELIARCRTLYVEICRAGEDCAIVSHGGPLVVLKALFLGRTVDLLAPKASMGSIDTIARAFAKAPAPPAGSSVAARGR